MIYNFAFVGYNKNNKKCTGHVLKCLLMMYREIIAVCSQIHTKHVNTLCGQKVELFKVQPGGA